MSIPPPVSTRKSVLVISLCLVVLAGCTDNQNWSLSVNGHLEEVDEAYVFVGEVRLGGNLGGVSVSGVEVEFLDDINETQKLARVGRLNGDNSQGNLSVSLEERPVLILVLVEDIRSPDQADYGVAGLELRSGRYHPYTDYDSLKRSYRTSAS